MKLAIVALCVFLPSFLPAVFAGMKPTKLGPVDPALPDPKDSVRSRHFYLIAEERSNPNKVDGLKIHKNRAVTSWTSGSAEFAIVGSALIGKPEAANEDGWKYTCVPEKKGVKKGPLSFGTGHKGVPGCTAWNEFELGPENKLLYHSSDTFYNCKGEIYFSEVPMRRSCIPIYITYKYK
ncbi:hypothetical protein FRC02_006382 [Tulasnella sp. 418]|nr:hypothetical protein FRC02_006382 [Tulasnella sp. 418]